MITERFTGIALCRNTIRDGRAAGGSSWRIATTFANRTVGRAMSAVGDLSRDIRACGGTTDARRSALASTVNKVVAQGSSPTPAMF